MIRTRTCTKCGETKPLDDFYVNKRSLGGYMRRCKMCVYGANRKGNKKIDKERKDKRKHLERIRASLPKDTVRTCGFYNPNERIYYTSHDLHHDADLWASVIEGARHGLNGGSNNTYPPNPHFFTEKDGVYAWLKDHMGVE